MQRFPASVSRPKSTRVGKVTNVPVLSETPTLSSNRKRLRRVVSDGVLFDVKATSDSQHAVNEIDSSGESNVSTLVMRNDLDDAFHGRQSPTPLLHDDLANLAAKLSADNRARLLKLLQDDSESAVVHLDDDRVPLSPQVPKDAKPLRNFVEFEMPTDNCLCGVHALRTCLSVFSGKTHVALASKMRDTLFELLPCYFDVPIVGEMTYTQWARAHGKSAEAMMHAEKAAVGLSNFLLAMIAYMHRVDSDIYNLCVGNPNYLILVQRARTVTQSIGLMSVLYRGENVSNYLGHYNIVVPTDSDHVARFRTITSSLEVIDYLSSCIICNYINGRVTNLGVYTHTPASFSHTMPSGSDSATKKLRAITRSISPIMSSTHRLRPSPAREPSSHRLRTSPVRLATADCRRRDDHTNHRQ